jgi:hypothetical protein
MIHDFHPIPSPVGLFTHICVNCDMRIIKDLATGEVLNFGKLQLHPNCDSFSTHQVVEA